MKRFFTMLLCLLLLVPVLLPCLFVPVSAETQKYLYNGVELPALPSHPETPYAIIEYLDGCAVLAFIQEYKFDYNVGKWSVYRQGVHHEYLFEPGYNSWGDYGTSTSDYWVRANFASVITWANFDIVDAFGNVILSASDPVPVGGASSGIPDFVVNESWDSSQVYAFQEETTADVFTISAALGDGWAPSYQWYYGSSQGGTFTAMPAETLAAFVPKTTAEYLGTTIYYCAVTVSFNGQSKTVNSDYLQVQVTETPPPETEPTEPTTPIDPGGDDSGVSDKLDDVQQGLDDVQQSVDRVEDKVDQLPGQIGDSIQDALEQEKEQAKNEGDAGANEVIDLIPNPSTDFLPVFNNLVSVLRYEGTAAVLTLPEISIPAIPGVFSKIHLLDSQQINFEPYIDLIPETLLALVRAIFDAAIVLFCVRELIDLIGSALTGFRQMHGAKE